MNTGKINQLKVNREEKQGYYLLEEDTGEEVLLPWNNTEGNLTLGNTLEVFIYRDSEDRRIATQYPPDAEEGEFVALTVKDSGERGTFLDWGLMKDLIVPRSEQRQAMHTGETHVVKICLDPRTDRLFGSAQIEFFLEEAPVDLPLNEPFAAIVYNESPIGFSCVVENQYAGMIYRNQVFQKISVGDTLTVYVQQVREDGKLDVMVRKAGYHGTIEEDIAKIEFYLNQNEGKMPYDDKSSPEEIRDIFSMSKKQFKKALGALYKEQKIIFKSEATYLKRE